MGGRLNSDNELPPSRAVLDSRAVRLEWWTVAFFVSAVALIFALSGSSEAMKAAALEDLLGIVPPAAFLIANRVRYRPSTEEFPYGFHRSISVGYLVSSVALIAVGIFVMFESVTGLLNPEPVELGTFTLFGVTAWKGWLLIAALVWTLVVPLYLGRRKLELASALHDKVLYADAKMNKADWLSAGAAIVGVLGIGMHWYWLDPLAAGVIGLDVLHDGQANLRTATADLMDRRPRTVDRSKLDGLTTRIENELRKLPWVKDSTVRLRESGHVFFGEALVVPKGESVSVSDLEDAVEMCRRLDWRLYGITVGVASELPG